MRIHGLFAKYARTPLYLAADRGRLDIVLLLLNAGSDPDAPNYASLNPFARATLIVSCLCAVEKRDTARKSIPTWVW